ncbi:NFACT family protein [Streptobacillus felis]|uniref:Fibronectin-binding domain-containing protein n=1 Tax=Streptobacillus felis TaxID=1384509 RepID=A0A7Z0PG50_9FUSO|nr:NFACT family protein [Streptobacillus felis]NYV28141.1 fibronectin-binding domain-containing protein [Streptobacillus felis]
MIYLDSVGINFLVKELKAELLNFKVNKIIQYDSNSFSLFFSKKQLFFQTKDNESIIYLKEPKEDNVNFSSSFLLSLKKYLDHAELVNIELLNNDRIIRIEFKRVNILGNLDTTYIIFEMMGRHSNIFLLNEEEKIINILNNNTSIENRRFYSINSPYEYFSNDKSELNSDKLFTSPEEMISEVSGIGKIFANDTYDNLELRKKYISEYIPYIFTSNDKYYITYNNFKKFENYESNIYESLNKALNEYFTTFINTSLLRNKKSNIEKVVNNRIKKNVKILKNIENDINRDKNYDEYKNIGDLLTSYLYLIKPRMETIEVYDYINNCNVNIELNPNKTPSDNLKIYYNKYRKGKKSIQIANERKILINDELNYLEEILDFVKRENDFLGLVEIEKELGIYKEKNNKKIKEKKRELLKFTIDDFDIFVGRNHTENNFLTFEKAKNHDIWLHVRDIPGSHVIIITNKRKVPENVLYEAAKLAALNSKGVGNKVVDYTERSNVKRVNKFGNVTFNNFKSLEIK